ncbi:hypothetical protein [Streptomyces sp. NPDC049879]|uniref:hypothetical protein n=1 Tax=Streptomyces sp. NPDC049879 TaxID=3365598 RepID=UPI003791E314
MTTNPRGVPVVELLDDMANDPSMRPLRFVGGPWDGQTRYTAKASWNVDPLYVSRATDDDGEHWEVEPPPPSYKDPAEDTRPRYNPTQYPERGAPLLMVWHDPEGFDPMNLVPVGRDDAAEDLIVEHAVSIYHEMVPPFGGTIRGQVAIAAQAAAADVAAVVLHRLVAVLPGITADQRAFLDDTAARLGFEVVQADTAEGDR